MLNTPPMLSKGLPFLGHALEFRNDLDQVCQRGYEEHKGMFAIKLLGANVAVINGPDLNKFFYTQTDKMLNIGMVYDNLKSAIGEAIFIGTREQYTNQRPLLQSIFTRDKMGKYVVAMEKEILFWLENLGEEGTTNLNSDFMRLTQYVAGAALLGSDFRKHFDGHFWAAFEDLSKAMSPAIPKNLPLPVNIRRDRGRRLIKKTFDPIVDARRQNPNLYDDTIAILATTPQKDGSFMTNQEIVDFMTALFWAAHETTAGQSAWLITLLLQHPDYLETICEEIETSLSVDEPISGGALRKLKHIYWAIDEAARLRPAAPIQMRIVEEDLELDGYHIPAGWLVMVNGPVTHTDPDLWEDPEVFDPYRHSPDRHEGRNAFKTVSFGGGIHKCTGMSFAKNEMAIMMGRFFQQFEVELLSEDPHVVFGQGAARPSEVWVKYKKRETPLGA
ncbi:MAG: cytochrome P450 [Chloroflexota bacterium]